MNFFLWNEIRVVQFDSEVDVEVLLTFRETADSGMRR